MERQRSDWRISSHPIYRNVTHRVGDGNQHAAPPHSIHRDCLPYQTGATSKPGSALEDLEPIDKVEPETLALLLQLCADLERWEMGENILGVLATADDETHRVTCAEWLHCFARHLVAAGDLEKAKQSVGHAVELWQPIRVELIEDDALAAIW